MNLSEVLGLLRRHGPLSRAGLATRSGLSRTTLHDILASLTGKGAVVTTVKADTQRGRGRPVETLALNPDAGQAIGIDFVRRAVHVAIVNVAHEVVGRRRRRTQPTCRAPTGSSWPNASSARWSRARSGWVPSARSAPA